MTCNIPMKGTLLIVSILPLMTTVATIGFLPIESFKGDCSVVSGTLACHSANFTENFPQFDASMINFLCTKCIIPTLPGAVFSNAPNLTTLYLRKTKELSSIAVNAFHSLTQLLDLELENSNLDSSAISVSVSNLFSGLRNLKQLKITKVKIESLPSGFVGSNLLTFIIENTGLLNILSSAFNNARNLESLTINEPVNSISFEFLTPLVRLKELKITAMKSNTFTIPSSVSNLQYLRLTRIAELRIESKSFGGSEKTITKFEIVYSTLYDPNLSNLEKLTNLQTLSLSHSSSFKAVPLSVRKLSSLTMLDLSNTGITSIKADDFPHTKKLKKLNLNLKSLTSINVNAFDSLNLADLSLTFVDTKMVHLHDGASASTWRDLFGKIANTLQRLRMLQCNIDDGFWDYLSVLKNSQYLALDHNNFQSIKEFVFAKFTQLIHVSLGNNKITSVNSKSTYGIPFSANIELQNNNIITIDNCTFAGRKITDSVNLDSTSLICDCRLLWLRDALQKSGRYSKRVICSTSGPNPGLNLTVLTSEKLTCSPGKVPIPCSVIPYTTPLPPAPPVAFIIHQKNNVIRVIVNNTMTRWYRHGIVYYSPLLSTSGSFKSTPVFSLSGPSESLDGLESGKFYNICVQLLKSKPTTVAPIIVLENGIDRRCETFHYIATTTNLGLIAGLSVVGALLVAVIVVLAVWCYCRRARKDKSVKEYSEKEDIYEEYAYPPNSSIYSPAPPQSTKSHPVPRRFVRASEISRSGTQSTVLSPTASRFDISRSTVSLAVQNRNGTNSMLSGQPHDQRRFMSLHDLDSGNRRKTSGPLPNTSVSMDELNRRQGRRPPFIPDKERANRSLPNPNVEDYTYIEESDEYRKTPNAPSPKNEYLSMEDSTLDKTDSQYISMSSANSLDHGGVSRSPDDSYGPVVAPPNMYSNTPAVPPRPGLIRRPQHATESQLSLVNNRESANSIRHDGRPNRLDLSSADMGSV